MSSTLTPDGNVKTLTFDDGSTISSSKGVMSITPASSLKISGTAATGLDVTVGTFGSTPAANGASISATTQVLTLQPADATHPGALTVAAQTIAGDKTVTGTTIFSGQVYANDVVSAIEARATTIPNVSSSYNGHLTRGVCQAAIAQADSYFTTAANTQSKIFMTIPARTRIVAVYCSTTTPWSTCASTIAMKLGVTSGGGELIASHDVKTAAVTKGLADADMGTGMTRAAAIQGGYLPSFSATTSLYVTLTVGAGNVADLADGNTTIYVILEQIPA